MPFISRIWRLILSVSHEFGTWVLGFISRIWHAIHLTHLAVDFVDISRIWHLGIGFYLTNLAYHLRELYRIEVSLDYGTLAMSL
jgi:hypothetical protein